MKVLVENILPEFKPMLVESDGKGFLYLKGLCLQGDIQNQNGRNYPRSEIERAVNEMNDRIKARGPIAGELDHPEGLNINFDRISHVITEMRMAGSDAHGTFRIINAGLGLIVKGCVEAGMQIGVSSRGSGNVDGSGRVSDFSIVTIDCVVNPSAPDAYPRPSLAESIGSTQAGREALRLAQYVRQDTSAQRHLTESIRSALTEIRDQVMWR